MAWEIDIPDVVGNQTIATSWGNPVRDRMVHPVALWADLPTSGISDGAVAFVGDRDKFYGRVNNLWKEIFTQDAPFTVGTIDGTKANSAVFQHADGSQFIQIGTLRQIQAFSAGAAAELVLNPLGGLIALGAGGVFKIDPAGQAIQFGLNDKIIFDDAGNEYKFTTENVPCHINVNQVHASGSVACVGLSAGAGAISGGSLNVGAGAISGGAITGTTIGGTTITASTKFATGATDFDEGLVKRNSGGSLSLHCVGNDIVIGVGNARTFYVKNNLTGADLMTLQLSGARVAACYPSGLPELGGMLDVGIVSSSWQLGIPTSLLAHKQSIAPVDKSLVWDMHPVQFTWNDEFGGEDDIGFIAEELDAIDHRLTTHGPGGQLYGVNRNAILAELVIAVQELRKMIDDGASTTEQQNGNVFGGEHQLQFGF